jgi:alkaline phosphatase
MGRHGISSRTDDLDLIAEAKRRGCTVVYNRTELEAAAANSNITRVLGVFAWDDTFQTMTEEALREARLPLFWPWAPSIAEMSNATLTILSRNPKAATRGMFIVAEEEATDNLPNKTNAPGSFEAGGRADEAFGVFADFVNRNPNTLLLTTADSSAGSKDIIGWDPPIMAVNDTAGWADVNTDPDGVWV